MKKFLILIMLLCGINAMAQENAASLPELQEWYSIKGGVGFYVSYLPGFDSVGGGMNAISYKFNHSNNPVFYNRFPFDTVNQFQWKSGGGYAVFQLDANGDGIPDYFDYLGRIYRGRKGQKPESEPSVNLNRSGTLWTLIGDLNKDSLEDMLVVNSNTNRNFDIILGNKDISKISAVRVSFPVETSHYIGSYFSESGKPRIIFYYDWGSFESFTIYAVTITYTGNQPSVALEQLDSIEKSKGSSDEKIYDYLSTFFIYDESSKITILVANRDDIIASEIWKIENDKFVGSKKTKNFGSSVESVLSSSITGVGTQTLIHPTLINNAYHFGVFSSDIWNDTTLYAYVKYQDKYNWEVNFSSIGDVNNDGINDVAAGYEGGIDIYLGIDILNKAPFESVGSFFKIHQNIPNPVQKDRKTLLPVSLKQQGNYSVVLYSLQGSKIKELFIGELSEGEHNIPLDLMDLSAG
ncbi:MAG: hypothetical protein J0M05_12955, partial [Candidatus Kapabacteria bacterium]|nr:hypothetical protein [Candidatus Kapabacteria bacterium]